MRTSVTLSSLAALLLAVSVQAADSYSIDASHTNIGFSVKHMVVSNTKGQFKTYDGKILFDAKDASKSSVKVTIKAASIDTSNEKRDAHLRTGDFFETDKFPEITFVSKKVAKKGDAYEVTGALTIKGVTKDVTFPFTLTGPVNDPWGNTRLGVEGSLTINRQDFGVSWNNTLDNGGLVVGNDVKIDLSVEGVKDKK